MNFLRALSTRRLLAAVAGAVALAIGATAIALAATGTATVPAPKPLATAVHDAVTAPTVAGVSARITFTNKLIAGGAVPGTNPLLGGATGRLWASSDGHLRLELQSAAGDAQILSDGHTVSVYDGTSNTVYRVTLPADNGAGAGDQSADSAPTAPPTVADIQAKLTELMDSADVSAANPVNVAGRPAYSVRITPKDQGGLLGAAELAWDADHGTPLRAAVYARGDSTPVLELAATDISFGPVPSSTFDVQPPAGAQTVNVDLPSSQGSDPTAPDVTGVAAVSRAISFPLAAPDTLAGLPRNEVRLVDLQGQPAALVTYGSGLGTIAVLEQASDGSTSMPSSSSDHGLSLPSVSINGVSAQELPTALGTVLRFSRSSVDYTVAGSVPQATAETAARGL
jgi:outer membrane lipoprotein-sorting protein